MKDTENADRKLPFNDDCAASILVSVRYLPIIK